MTNLAGRTVVVTGASAGIGRAVALAFGAEGCRLVLAARRREKLAELEKALRDRHGAEILTIELDVRDRGAVESTLGALPPAWSEVDVLINNAGLGRGLDKLQEGNPDEWDEMIDTNVKGLLYVTRALLPGMVARKRGHVINIGSVAGREVYPGGNVYCASKFAVKALTRALKVDLLGTPIRVSTIDPGMVETDFSVVRFRGDEERAAKVYQGIKALSAEDIADIALWIASRPPHVDITELVVMPTAQATAMLNHREP
ncbi:MAG: SDR family oxidoreductase [Acidobacteriota bacterium]